MKNLSITLGVVLLTVSCAVTVPYAGTVIDQCKYDNFGDYYGDCIFQTYDTHQNRDAYLEQYNYRTAWKEIEQINKTLINALEMNLYSVDDANEMFMNKFLILHNMDVERDRQKQEAWAKAMANLSESLNNSNNTLNGRTGINVNQGVSSSPGMMYTLSDNYVSGMNRICIYKLGSQTATHTMKGIGMCPITKKF